MLTVGNPNNGKNAVLTIPLQMALAAADADVEWMGSNRYLVRDSARKQIRKC